MESSNYTPVSLEKISLKESLFLPITPKERLAMTSGIGHPEPWGTEGASV